MKKLRLKKTNGFTKDDCVPILYTLKRGYTYEFNVRETCHGKTVRFHSQFLVVN